MEPIALPKLSPIRNKDWWIVTEDWVVLGYLVPTGFESDLDTVPRIPFVYSLFKGHARWSALLHDYLYHSQLLDRKEADLVFLRMMEMEHITLWRRRLMYLAVRTFGVWRWRQVVKRQCPLMKGRSHVGIRSKNQ